MKKRTGIVAAAVLAIGVLAVAPFAFAQHRGMHERGDFGSVMMLGHLQRAKQALGLSDDQVSQIQAIFTDLKTQNAPYRDSMRSGMHSVLQTLLANPNDVAAAQAVIDQQTAAERTMKTNALNAAAKALNVLTSDQRAKLATFVQERMAHRAAR